MRAPLVQSQRLIATRGVSRRNASSHAHDEHHDHGHGSQDTYQYAPEGLSWRSSRLFLAQETYAVILACK